MSDLKLGHIIEGEQFRDAIHIAVAPVAASHALEPGEHVGFNEDGRADKNADNCIGIVDPFLRKAVQPLETFWLFLYPNTVTGLRHEWTHPAFTKTASKESKTETTKSLSEQWMRAWAVQHFGEDYYSERKVPEQEAYDFAIEAGYSHNIGPYESARDSMKEEWWDHWENITGQKGDRDTYFSCGC